MSFHQILIVDGNLQEADEISRGLRLLGYHVEAVASERAALQIDSGNAFDIGIFSELLPDGDGADCFRRVSPRQTQMRGILLAARGNLPTVCKALDAGMQHVLSRPVRFVELLPVLEAGFNPEVLRMESHAPLAAAAAGPRFSPQSIATLTTEAIHTSLTREELIEIIRSVEYPFAGKDRLQYFDRDTLERVVHLVRRWCQTQLHVDGAA